MSDNVTIPSLHSQFNPHKGTDAFEHHARAEQMAREYAIAVEHMSLTRQRLAHCFRTEGVNQAVNCLELREHYYDLCMDRFRGMKFPPGAEPVSRRVPSIILPSDEQ